MRYGRKAMLLVVVALVAGSGVLAATSALADEAGTADQRAEPSGEQVSVVDVTATTHDGVDRVTFELAGDGQAGYVIGYVDEPRSDGSGFLVDVAGDAALRVIIRSVVFPPDAPEGLEPLLDDVAGPAGGVVLEVVNDLIFEGDHTFFVGLDQELAFRVQRLDDPQRVVVEIVHPDEDDGPPVPVDGVEAGHGGAASGQPVGPVLLALGLVLLLVASGALWRRRTT